MKVIKKEQMYQKEWDNQQNAPIKRLGHSNSGIKRLGYINGSGGGMNNLTSEIYPRF